MTYRLAIALASERVGAAVVDHGNVNWFALGEGGAGVLPAVHLGDDGTASVGDDALAAAVRPGRFDPDPVGSLGTDERAVESVAALLAAVVGEVTSRRGEAPELVMLAHPDDWPAAQGRALTEAARRAGIDSFERVSAGAATDAYRKVSGGDGGTARAVGYGAAVLAAGAVALDATRATPAAAGLGAIITLEDIAGPLPDASSPEPPTYESEGSSSVFDHTPAPATTPPTRAQPVVPPPPPPPSAPPPSGADGDNGWARWAVVLGVLAAVLLLALIVVLVNDDGGGDQVATNGSTTTVGGSTSSLAASSTTSASSTSTTSSTTTSSTTTSTTTTSTTTTSTTTTTTTTAAPAPVDVEVEPGELVVDPSGSPTVIPIGSDGTFAVSTLILALGEPDDDTGFVTATDCITAAVKRVRWRGLELVLLDDADQSVGQWFVKETLGDTSEFVTSAGIGVGSTVTELQAAYPGVELTPAGSGLEEGIFVVRVGGQDLVGVTTGLESDDTVDSMWSGDGCQRLFL